MAAQSRLFSGSMPESHEAGEADHVGSSSSNSLAVTASQGGLYCNLDFAGRCLPGSKSNRRDFGTRVEGEMRREGHVLAMLSGN